MRFASKMNILSESIIVEFEKRRIAKVAAGEETINLSVGIPDMPPPPHVVEALREACLDPENMKYPITDMPDMIDSVIRWYKRRYGVILDSSEVTSLCGSQDGLGHIGLVMCDPGETMLVPDPGYPIFIHAAHVAGAKNYYMSVAEANGFLPVLEDIPASVAHDAKMMTISYPANPLGVSAPDWFFEKVIQFAKKYDIMVLHDNAYSELVFDGREGKSFLSYPGAKDIGIEFNSLSKSYNMTGFRISFALGNKDVIRNIAALKSHIDYRIFRPVQRAAIAALDGPQDCVAFMRDLYQHRRDVLISEFGKVGWHIRPSEGTMFVFAKIPDKFASSMDFAIELMDKTGVIVVPGIGFGPGGEGYVRIALIQEDDVVKKAAQNIAQSGLLVL